MPAGQKATDWNLIYLDYVNAHTDPKGLHPPTLRELAAKWNVSYGSLRNRASADKWRETIQEEVANRSCTVLEVVREVDTFTEVDIRLRQAKIARLALDRAVRRLSTLDWTRLSHRETIELLKLGLVEERAALGLAERFQLVESTNDSDFASVKEHIQEKARLDALVKRFHHFVEEKVGSAHEPKH